jgi:hypothetical protein
VASVGPMRSYSSGDRRNHSQPSQPEPQAEPHPSEQALTDSGGSRPRIVRAGGSPQPMQRQVEFPGKPVRAKAACDSFQAQHQFGQHRRIKAGLAKARGLRTWLQARQSVHQHAPAAPPRCRPIRLRARVPGQQDGDGAVREPLARRRPGQLAGCGRDDTAGPDQNDGLRQDLTARLDSARDLCRIGQGAPGGSLHHDSPRPADSVGCRDAAGADTGNEVPSAADDPGGEAP